MINQELDLILLFVSNPQKSAHFYEEILNLSPVEKSPTFVMFVLKNGFKVGL